MTLNVIVTRLSDIEKEYKLTLGTFTVDLAVHSTDMFAKPISEWAEGKSFEVTVKDPATQIEAANSPKVLINGQLYILRGEHLYDSIGKMVK